MYASRKSLQTSPICCLAGLAVACGQAPAEAAGIAEMMGKRTYTGILLATKDLDATFERCRPATPRSSGSRPSSRTGFATAPSAIPR
jgi:hypothetical protein